MAGKQEAVVLFEYEKTQDDELSLKVGEVILDVVQADEGWCEGTLNGVRGMFPDNFVKVRPAQAAPSAQPPVDKPPVVRDTGGAIKNRRAKVAFSYAAENADELSLEPGEMVEILAEEEEGWFRGRVNGKEGVFPSNFLDANSVAEPPPPSQPVPAPAPEPARPEEPPASKQPMIGHKLFPSINPALARAQLKSSAEKKPAPPPPAEKKAVVERAKVLFEYTAENEDELTISVGNTVEIVSKDTDQDGWWKAKFGDKIGLIPDNFVELLPPSATPAHPAPSVKTKAPPPPMPSESKPPPKEAPHSAPPKPQPPRSGSVSRPSPMQPERPPPPTENKNTPQVKEEPAGESLDFGVPPTDPLDSSAIKDRPKKTSRPPSRSNLQGDSNDSPPESKPDEPAPAQGGGLSPWQAELQKRKAHKPPPPTPGTRPSSVSKKAVKPPEKPATKPPVTTHKPQTTTRPPHAKPTALPPRDTPSPHQPPVSPTPSSTPAPATSTPLAPTAAALPPDDSWKKAYESLQDEFDKFKSFVKEQLLILTNDLDDERKLRRGLEVDIDRLKKQSLAFP